MSDPKCLKCGGKGYYEDYYPLGNDIVQCDCQPTQPRRDARDERIEELTHNLDVSRFKAAAFQCECDSLRIELQAARACIDDLRWIAEPGALINPEKLAKMEDLQSHARGALAAYDQAMKEKK